jgi:hypothetical protein
MNKNTKTKPEMFTLDDNEFDESMLKFRKESQDFVEMHSIHVMNLGKLKLYRKEFMNGRETTKRVLLSSLTRDYSRDLFKSTDEAYSLETLAKSMINEFRLILRHGDCTDFLLE